MNLGLGKKIPPDWGLITSVFAALGDPTRQQIIMLFERGEALSIKDVASRFNLGRSTVVHHLTVLHSNGILNMCRHGRETLYSVNCERVLGAIRKMQLFIEGNIWGDFAAVQTDAGKAPTAAEYDRILEKLGIAAKTPLLFVRDNDDAKAGDK